MAFCGVCRTSNDEYRRLKNLQPSLTPAEILTQFEKCPQWYYRQVCRNTDQKQDNLTRSVCHSLAISKNQPLSYSLIPKLEDYFNVNIFVVSSALGNAFSDISQNCDEERKKICGVFSRSYFCSSCLTPYDHKHKHACKNHCSVCLSDDCEKQEVWICQD